MKDNKVYDFIILGAGSAGCVLANRLSEDENEIEAWIRKTATTDYHPSGTCKMRSDSDSVVNENLKVHGFKNLYVVDASIMPNVVSGNLNAPTQMIAEKFSDIILNKKPLDPINANYHFKKNLH